MMKSLHNTNFPTPRYLSMSSCALDISDKSIKYGRLIPNSNNLKLEFYGNEKIPDGVISSGKIVNEAKLIEILKALRSKHNLNFVRVSLPEEQMYIFNIILPKTDGGDLPETILLQLEEHIPISANDAVFDFDIISETDSDYFVQVAAADASFLESYLSVFERAGLSPLSFELEDQAIARAVVPQDSKETVMIVDFGQTRTGISIASAGRVLFSSTFDMGGHGLTDMVAKSFNVSFDEAEKLKKAYGKDQGTPNDLLPIIISNISVLRDELNKHYMYWHNHDREDGQPHPKIERILLCGGDANLIGIVQYLGASMKVPVEYVNTWVNVMDTSKDIPVMPFIDSLSYTTVIGLALNDFIRE
jgi:type IV pilus assembly protein PilM